jgi:hypothetical protein
MSILALSLLAAKSQIAGYSKELRRRAVLRDVWVNKKGLYNNDAPGPMPNQVYVEVENSLIQSSNTVTLTMKLPLTGPAVLGNSLFLNTEEAPLTKAAILYRNNWGKTVRTEKFGTRFVDQEPYKLYKQHIDDLGDWAWQFEGLEIRVNLCENFSTNLWVGDTSATCVPSINPHVHVVGLSIQNQPAFDLNTAVYMNNIVSGIFNAGSGSLAPTQSETASARLIEQIVIRALRLKIWPLSINGRDAFQFVVSDLFAAMYTDPTWGTDSGARRWIAINTAMAKEVQNWYGVIGMYRSAIGVDVIFCVDQKHPTFLPSGSGAPFSGQFLYMQPGDVDQRQLDNSLTRDVNILVGRGAFAVNEPEKLHFIQQDDNYFKIYGDGIAGVRGHQTVRFNNDTPTSAAQEYYGSMLVLSGRPAYV